MPKNILTQYRITMTINSTIKKHNKFLLSLAPILTIIDSLLKFLGLIPALVAVIILFFATILLIPFLLNQKLNPKFQKIIVAGIVIIFFVGIGYHFITANPGENVKSTTLNFEQNQSTNNSNNSSI